ncbi:3-oxoacyl-[acyl-carrier-protein] synthase III C-terminal domain-containing protein [Effusibacillus consociatus]|uniref:3-oxoacyl-[acyl-carrier-protein] synthase III C-terminal domain-containing protein n=1 Tax=Effusibacillus consociatus TaxID=1117041 RepID=A0ABV9QB65_9BACL
MAKNLDFEQEKVISTIQYYGNNSSATIPIAMDTAVKDGRQITNRLSCVFLFTHNIS